MPRVTLQAALSEASQREVRVRIAGAEVARARALIAAARANFLPTLIGHGTYVRLDHQRGPSGPSLIAARDQLLADVTLTVPIFSPHAWNDTGFASDQARLAELDLVDTQRTVAIATAQAYLTVMAQHRALEVTQRALDNANAHYQYAHQRFTGGIGNQVDDVRAGQEAATSTSDLEHVRASLYQAQEALAFLLGRNGPVDVVEELTLPSAPAQDEGLREALSRRSDVAADQQALISQQNLERRQLGRVRCRSVRTGGARRWRPARCRGRSSRAPPISSSSTSEFHMPCTGSASRRNSLVSSSRPASIASSRRSRLNHWRILLRARGEPTNCSQSRDGPAVSTFEVKISHVSPLRSVVSSGTSRPLTLAPMQAWPTSVCTA